MSLLLDALKRAEQEKLAKQGERPAPERAERAAPAAVPSAQSAASVAALELQPLHSAAAAAAHASAPRSDAAAAQTMFSAKSGTAPAANAASAGPKKTTVLLVAAGAIVIVIAAIGTYVWYSINSMRPQITTLRPRAAPAPPPASGEPLPPKFEVLLPPAPPGKADASTDAAAAARKAQIAPPSPAAPPAAAPEPRAEPRADDVVANLLRESRANAAPPLRLQPAVTPKPQVPSSVAAGYDQLRGGNLAEARRSYAAALAADGASLDAQLGMATVEARLGNRAAAASHYRRALDLDPRNATAVAGLASLAEYSQPDMLESQLRSDIARYPQSAALHFSLGNLFAAQGRWHDAQVSFFEAYRLEPAGADIAYNLAVSLDQVGQSRLAADFYRRALDGARNQVTQFDPAAVARRLSELGR